MIPPDWERTIELAEVAQRVRFLGSLLEIGVQQYLRLDLSSRVPQLEIKARLTEILATCQQVSIALEACELERRASNRPAAP